MTNPIADPLVETVLTGELDGLVLIESAVAGVVVVTLNRPDIQNALDGELAVALTQAFETLQAAEHVRVVFLRGAGGVFSSGADTEWHKAEAEDWSESELREEGMTVALMLRTLTEIPALTVALIEGEATGIGVGLVAACDHAVAASGAQFAFGEVKMGAAPALVAPYVVNAIGPRQAKGLFATGRRFDAAHAERIGLVQEVVEGAQGLSDAMQRLIAEALTNGPEAVHEAKRLVWEVWNRPLDHALMEDTAKRFARTRFSAEGREGLAAFLNGRPPSWAGR